MQYTTIIESIGNTPLVKINKLSPDEVNLYAKVESRNPYQASRTVLAML